MKTHAAGILLLIVSGQPTYAQKQTPAADRPQSAAELRAAPTEKKRAALNDLAAFRYSPSPEQTTEMIAAGLADLDPEVRVSAVYAAAGRASAVRFKTTPERVAIGNAERPFLGPLEAHVLRALSDPADRVRHGAVIALGNLGYEPGRQVNDILLKPVVAKELKLRLRVETAAAVRSEIVKSFALTSIKSPGRDDALLEALEDPDEDVVHFAVMGIARSVPVAALPRVASLVAHPSRAVRLQVGQALQAYGLAARPYLDSLKTALAAEQDDVVRKTLEGAIARIQSGG